MEAERVQPTTARRAGAGFGAAVGVLLGLALLAALVLFVAQNAGTVRVEWAVWDVEAPLAAVVLGAAVVAMLAVEIVGLAWRRSRQKRLREREEARSAAATGRQPSGEHEPKLGS